MSDALLVLSDGSAFPGRSVGVDGRADGEVVFNTSMAGYQEMLTDPSYAGQLLTLTYPMIGNYGVDAKVELAVAACESTGDVEQPVAECFWFGAGEFAVETHELGPCDETRRDERDGQPCLV